MTQENRNFKFGGVLAAASVPMFMAALNSLVMTFALPAVRADVGATLTELQWFVNIYTLLFATLMMPMTALGDRIGRRRVFLAGIALFAVASAGAALSHSVSLLILARAVQGIGAAAIVPLSLTILSVSSPAQRRALAIGIWGAVNGLGIAVGPIIGGAVVSGLHWSAIFWLNVPIGLLALCLGRALLRESHGSPVKPDIPGVLLAAAFVLLLTWGIVEGPQRGWGDAAVVAAFAVSAVSLAGFLFREHHSADAFLPLRLFRKRRFSLANLATFLFAAGVFGAIFFLSQFLEVAMGYGAFEAGLRASPWTLAPMVVAPFTGPIIHRIGTRAVLVTGLSLQAIALGWLALAITANVEYLALVTPMVLGGIGMGLTFAPLSTAVLEEQPEAEQSITSGVNNTLRQLGTAVGIALSTAIFSAAGQYLPGQPFIDGLHPTLITCTLILVCATITVALLPSRAKAEAIG